MAVMQMAEQIKLVHPDYLLLFKVGMFYDTYGKDSYIIAGNFDYSQNTVNGIQKCGFSRKVLRKSYNYIRKQKNKLYDNRPKK